MTDIGWWSFCFHPSQNEPDCSGIDATADNEFQANEGNNSYLSFSASVTSLSLALLRHMTLMFSQI